MTSQFGGPHQPGPANQQFPQGPAGQPYPGQPTAPVKVKKPIHKKWWFWLIVVILAVMVLSRLGGGGGSTGSGSEQTADQTTAAAPAEQTTAAAPAEQTTQEDTQAAEPPAEAVAGIGTPVEAGDTVFTVVSATKVTRLENFAGAKDGNWIELVVNVENKGNEAITISSSQITLISENGAEYESDSDSIMYIDSSESLFLEKINPGLAKQGKVLIAVTPEMTGGTVVFKPNLFGGPKAEVQVSAS